MKRENQCTYGLISCAETAMKSTKTKSLKLTAVISIELTSLAATYYWQKMSSKDPPYRNVFNNPVTIS